MTKSDLKGLAAREAGDASNVTSARATQGPHAPRNAEKLDKVYHLLSEGQSVEAACVGASLCRRTFYRWLSDHEDIRDLVEDAKVAGEGKILAEMRRHIDAKQDWKGLAWILERRWPERYSAKREIEVSTKKADGIPEVLAMLEQTQGMIDVEPDEDEGDE